jgi:hypothetical protein
MNKAKIINGILSISVVMPIWIYLWYKVLNMVGATDIMWFLFWVYVPVSFIVATIKIIADES